MSNFQVIVSGYLASDLDPSSKTGFKKGAREQTVTFHVEAPDELHAGIEASAQFQAHESFNTLVNVEAFITPED